ncbi:hypothetical protein N9917_01120 [Deltaproteobacteria bacterium]|nr:hypothetical protein [Deltaproteobacteria bacterium]
MWCLETIIAMNRAVGARVEEKSLVPVRLSSLADIHTDPPNPIPFLGDACDDWDQTYQRIDRIFVDLSGRGTEAGDAMTHAQARQWLTNLFEEHGPLMVALDNHRESQGWVVVWAEGSAST